MCFRESGTVQTVLRVPDTITTWEADAFCLSSEGFGLAPRADLKVFQPFFVELTLPYSIIRGEQFELKATVFSYLEKCIMVRLQSTMVVDTASQCVFELALSVCLQLTVTPEASADYQLVPLSGDQYTSCLCGGERKTLSWNMIPSTLGEDRPVLLPPRFTQSTCSSGALSLAGVVALTVTAEAVASQVSCDNEIVTVPERGRVDTVKRTLIVKVGDTSALTPSWWKGASLTSSVPPVAG